VTRLLYSFTLLLVPKTTQFLYAPTMPPLPPCARNFVSSQEDQLQQHAKFQDLRLQRLKQVRVQSKAASASMVKRYQRKREEAAEVAKDRRDSEQVAASASKVAVLDKVLARQLLAVGGAHRFADAAVAESAALAALERDRKYDIAEQRRAHLAVAVKSLSAAEEAYKARKEETRKLQRAVATRASMEREVASIRRMEKKAEQEARSAYEEEALRRLRDWVGKGAGYKEYGQSVPQSGPQMADVRHVRVHGTVVLHGVLSGEQFAKKIPPQLSTASEEILVTNVSNNAMEQRRHMEGFQSELEFKREAARTIAEGRAKMARHREQDDAVAEEVMSKFAQGTIDTKNRRQEALAMKRRSKHDWRSMASALARTQELPAAPYFSSSKFIELDNMAGIAPTSKAAANLLAPTWEPPLRGLRISATSPPSFLSGDLQVEKTPDVVIRCYDRVQQPPQPVPPLSQEFKWEQTAPVPARTPTPPLDGVHEIIAAATAPMSSSDTADAIEEKEDAPCMRASAGEFRIPMVVPPDSSVRLFGSESTEAAKDYDLYGDLAAPKAVSKVILSSETGTGSGREQQSGLASSTHHGLYPWGGMDAAYPTEFAYLRTMDGGSDGEGEQPWHLSASLPLQPLNIDPGTISSLTGGTTSSRDSSQATSIAYHDKPLPGRYMMGTSPPKILDNSGSALGREIYNAAWQEGDRHLLGEQDGADDAKGVGSIASSLQSMRSEPVLEEDMQALLERHSSSLGRDLDDPSGFSGEGSPESRSGDHEVSHSSLSAGAASFYRGLDETPPGYHSQSLLADKATNEQEGGKVSTVASSKSPEDWSGLGDVLEWSPEGTSGILAPLTPPRADHTAESSVVIDTAQEVKRWAARVQKSIATMNMLIEAEALQLASQNQVAGRSTSSDATSGSSEGMMNYQDSLEPTGSSDTAVPRPQSHSSTSSGHAFKLDLLQEQRRILQELRQRNRGHGETSEARSAHSRLDSSSYNSESEHSAADLLAEVLSESASGRLTLQAPAPLSLRRSREKEQYGSPFIAWKTQPFQDESAVHDSLLGEIGAQRDFSQGSSVSPSPSPPLPAGRFQPARETSSEWLAALMQRWRQTEGTEGREESFSAGDLELRGAVTSRDAPLTPSLLEELSDSSSLSLGSLSTSSSGKVGLDGGKRDTTAFHSFHDLQDVLGHTILELSGSASTSQGSLSSQSLSMGSPSSLSRLEAELDELRESIGKDVSFLQGQEGSDRTGDSSDDSKSKSMDSLKASDEHSADSLASALGIPHPSQVSGQGGHGSVAWAVPMSVIADDLLSTDAGEAKSEGEGGSLVERFQRANQRFIAESQSRLARVAALREGRSDGAPGADLEIISSRAISDSSVRRRLSEDEMRIARLRTERMYQNLPEVAAETRRKSAEMDRIRHLKSVREEEKRRAKEKLSRRRN
jgi:hypothetical protein